MFLISQDPVEHLVPVLGVGCEVESTKSPVKNPSLHLWLMPASIEGQADVGCWAKGSLHCDTSIGTGS